MKSKWHDELKLNSRYAVAGILNTFIGLGVILGLTKLGVKPIVANLLGYAIAFTFAFFGSKRFVFRTEGYFTSEFIRYLGFFVFSYIVNILVLYVCISWYDISPIVSQGFATFSYIISMYLSSRLFVFNNNNAVAERSVK